MLVGFVNVIKPLKFLRLKSRWMGGLLLALGFLLARMGGTLSDNETQPPARAMLIDIFMPDYHFNEVHSIRIDAPPDRIFRAIKAVTPQEIRFFRTLTWIRSLPARLKGKGRARGDKTKPLLELATNSGFVLLAEEANRELVCGTISRFWKLPGDVHPRIASPQEFLAFNRPDYAKTTVNFYVEDRGEGWFKVTTETRIFALDPAARKKFALYWWVIYPGSASLRRNWLKAIKRRAEAEEQLSVVSGQ